MNNLFLTSKNKKLKSLLNRYPEGAELEKCLTIEILNCEYRGLVNSTEWLNGILKSKNLKMCVTSIMDFTKSLNPYFDIYGTSEIFFEKEEFLRCSHHLKDCLKKHEILDFLYFYSRFKVSLNDLFENESDCMNNDSLISLKEDIEVYIDEYQNYDAYVLYLYGMILKKLNLNKDARSVLVKALKRNQYLWPAWFELIDITKFDDIDLPNNWMRHFFQVKALKLVHNNEECEKVINNLMKNGFDNVDDLKIDLAIINEEMSNSSYSLEIFKEIYKKDPFRMDYFCTFSNILFVQGNHKMLLELSKHCVENDRYRYETSCVVGNFYSLQNQHEKAVSYFQRALKMNSTDSNTWLLTAHEYFELKNVGEAINCYKKAITCDQNNYRAHYGLGQIYEMLSVYKLSLKSYRKAFELKPKDSRILVALGSVYEEFDKHEEAKYCYYRAHSIGDVEYIALFKLGKLFEKTKDMLQAAVMFNLFVEEVQDVASSNSQNINYAYMFLALYYRKYTSNREKALEFALKCCERDDTKDFGLEIIRKTKIDRDDDDDYYLENAFMN